MPTQPRPCLPSCAQYWIALTQQAEAQKINRNVAKLLKDLANKVGGCVGRASAVGPWPWLARLWLHMRTCCAVVHTSPLLVVQCALHSTLSMHWLALHAFTAHSLTTPVALQSNVAPTGGALPANAPEPAQLEPERSGGQQAGNPLRLSSIITQAVNTVWAHIPGSRPASVPTSRMPSMHNAVHPVLDGPLTGVGATSGRAGASPRDGGRSDGGGCPLPGAVSPDLASAAALKLDTRQLLQEAACVSSSSAYHQHQQHAVSRRSTGETLHSPVGAPTVDSSANIPPWVLLSIKEASQEQQRSGAGAAPRVAELPDGGAPRDSPSPSPTPTLRAASSPFATTPRAASIAESITAAGVGASWDADASAATAASNGLLSPPGAQSWQERTGELRLTMESTGLAVDGSGPVTPTKSA